MVEPTTEERLFCRAIELPASERAEFLQKCCGDHSELKQKVQNLLRLYETDENFLETPACHGELVQLVECPGQEIGNYRLLDVIGQGGFGTVWRAEQYEPVVRQVAIKVVKQGVRSDAVMARFSQERQTLAILSHPNIATVFDAGVADSGRPYFVMELVDGLGLEKYCDLHQFDEHQRCRLMITICQAIQHAHLKGIVHRDLKPSNILVANIDGQVVPKIIDFGIAKAMRQEERELASNSPAMGTPHYMSPEQLRNEPDVDSRADVYSLGVILDQLITANSFRSFDNSEIKCIVDKAKQSDRSQRYSTAIELAEDLQRWLDVRPVAAVGQKPFYILSKSLQRNRVLFTCVTISLLALVVGLYVSLIGWRNAEKQRGIADQQKTLATRRQQDAEKQRELFEEKANESRLVANYLKRLVNGSNPGASQPLILRPENLEEVSASLESLADYPSVESELQMTVARAFHNLSKIERAEQHYRRALELRVKLLGPNRPKTILSRLGLASCLLRLRRHEEAENYLDIVFRYFENKKKRINYVRALKILGQCRSQELKHKEAYRVTAHALEVCRELPGDQRVQTSLLLAQLSACALTLGRLDEAAKTARESLELRMEATPKSKFYLANTRLNLVQVLVEQGKYLEAFEESERVISEYRSCVDSNDQHLIRSFCLKAKILWHVDAESEDAIAVASEAVLLAESLPKNHTSIRAHAYRVLARTLTQSRPQEACSAWEKAILFRRKHLSVHVQVASHLLDYANLLQELEEFESALSQTEKALEILNQLDHPKMLAHALEQKQFLIRILQQPVVD